MRSSREHWLTRAKICGRNAASVSAFRSAGTWLATRKPSGRAMTAPATPGSAAVRATMSFGVASRVVKSVPRRARDIRSVNFRHFAVFGPDVDNSCPAIFDPDRLGRGVTGGTGKAATAPALAGCGKPKNKSGISSATETFSGPRTVFLAREKQRREDLQRQLQLHAVVRRKPRPPRFVSMTASRARQKSRVRV